VKRRRVVPLKRPRCVLDSGGLTALLGRSQRARAWYRWVVEHGGTVSIPTPVLVETTTGDGALDAEVNRVLRVLAAIGHRLIAPDEALARRAGSLRYRARSKDAVDAMVAAIAIGDGSPCVLLTSDPDDLRALLSEAPTVTVERV
jgi:predicted nucleic acid-binding protein